MSFFTKAELLKAARATAKKHGFTFKANDSVTLNGSKCYMVVNRETGDVAAQYIRLDERVEENILSAISK